MDSAIRKEIEERGADPDFVRFVLAWHGVIGATDVPFTAEKESPTYQKKIKRLTQKDFGTKWRFYWNLILNDCWKMYRKMVLQRNLFKMEPKGTNPPHKRRNEALWNAVFDLRNYFQPMNEHKRPPMRLLAALLDQDEETFHEEWYKRKDWFEDENGAERLQRLKLFFQYNRERILESLRTGVPIYAKWGSNPDPVRAVARPEVSFSQE
jgi:hypothetical protein